MSLLFHIAGFWIVKRDYWSISICGVQVSGIPHWNQSILIFAAKAASFILIFIESTQLRFHWGMFCRPWSNLCLLCLLLFHEAEIEKKFGQDYRLSLCCELAAREGPEKVWKWRLLLPRYMYAPDITLNHNQHIAVFKKEAEVLNCTSIINLFAHEMTLHEILSKKTIPLDIHVRILITRKCDGISRFSCFWFPHIARLQNLK